MLQARKFWLLALTLQFVANQTLEAETVVTVAADGSGKFQNVQEAIMSVPDGRADNPVIIRIAPGTYKEPIYIQREKRFFHLVGEDPKTTILTYDRHANMKDAEGRPLGTFRTPSVHIDADDFTAENLTFENSAGPVGQALAIRVDGDRAIFRNCRFLGWQDTVLLSRGRQYFEDCYIQGDTDFIFGGATAYFDRCHIHCLRSSYLTAAATPDFQPFGFVFANCKITAESDKVRTYLGRPWRGFAAVTFLNTEMPAAIRPEGWHNWNQPEREKTARYAEFGSRGPGAAPEARVKWARQLSEAEAADITLEKVLRGNDGWWPARASKDSSGDDAAASNGVRQISLSSVTTTMDQEGLQQLRDGFQAGSKGGSASNVFLVDAPDIASAIDASSGVLFGERSADYPVGLNMPDAPRGNHWLVAFLGTGPSGENWIAEGATVEGKSIRFTYHKRKPGPETADVNYYWYWVPLDKLDAGVYQLELFDSSHSAVTLMRRVEVGSR